MFEGHINLPTLIVLKWVLLLAYLNHQIPMSYILDSQEGFTSRFLYCGSLLVLVVYSILNGLTAKKSQWLGYILHQRLLLFLIRRETRLDEPQERLHGACLYGFQLLQSLVAALFVAGASRTRGNVFLPSTARDLIYLKKMFIQLQDNE